MGIYFKHSLLRVFRYVMHKLYSFQIHNIFISSEGAACTNFVAHFAAHATLYLPPIPKVSISGVAILILACHAFAEISVMHSPFPFATSRHSDTFNFRSTFEALTLHFSLHA